MPLNTGISGDISFINIWTFIHLNFYINVIECFWDISTRYDNYVAHQHIHHLHGEQMNLIKDTWHTRHTPRAYPPLCDGSPRGGEETPPCFWKTVQSKKILGKIICEILSLPLYLIIIYKDEILHTPYYIYRGGFIYAYLISNWSPC